MKRVAIVFDGKKWYVRRMHTSVEDWTRGEMIYYCDKPIANDLTINQAVDAAMVYLGRSKKRRREA
jgi:hypothetical protein